MGLLNFEWIVWLADGSTMDSAHHRWSDVPDRVLVVRWWGEKTKGINWGDSLYGEPGTYKGGVIVDDDLFQRVLATAQKEMVKPSER